MLLLLSVNQGQYVGSEFVLSLFALFNADKGSAVALHLKNKLKLKSGRIYPGRKNISTHPFYIEVDQTCGADKLAQGHVLMIDQEH